MPYKLVGKCVYAKKAGKWRKKGCSKDVATAKKYFRKLQSVHEKETS